MSSYTKVWECLLAAGVAQRLLETVMRKMNVFEETARLSADVDVTVGRLMALQHELHVVLLGAPIETYLCTFKNALNTPIRTETSAVPGFCLRVENPSDPSPVVTAHWNPMERAFAGLMEARESILLQRGETSEGQRVPTLPELLLFFVDLLPPNEIKTPTSAQQRPRWVADPRLAAASVSGSEE